MTPEWEWDHNHPISRIPPLAAVQEKCPACIVGNAKRRAGDIAAPHIAAPETTPAGVLDEAALRKALAEILAAYDATPADVPVDTWVRFHAALLAGRAALGRSGSGGGRSRAEPAGIRLMGYYEGRRANPCPHTAIEPQRPAPNAPECTCEGEFVWACGPECMCVHHEKAVDDELPNYADDEYNGRLPWSQ